MGKKLLAYSLLSVQLFSGMFLYSAPKQVVAQNATKFSSRLTIPVAPNGVMVIQNTHGIESQQAIVSDVLSTTKFSISDSGSITSANPYYPYGNQVRNSADINPNNRYYTGQRKVVNDDTLYNYNARFYNPDTGIFTQPDVAEGFNRFAYVNGNPITNSDPSGYISTDSRGPGYQGSSKELLLMPSYENRLPIPGNPGVYTEQMWENEKEAAVRDMKIVALGAPIGALVGYYGGPAAIAAGGACVASLGPCLMGIGDALMMATGSSTIPSIPIPFGNLKSLGRQFAQDESGTFLPLMGRSATTALEVTDVADEVVAAWTHPQMARLKAPPEFRQDLLQILKGESPAVIYADTGKPIAIPQQAIKTIASRFGPKGLQDQRLMKEFANTLYQLSQDPLHHGLKTHKITSPPLRSSTITDDWRVGWEWAKMQILTTSGEFEEMTIIQLLTVGQHSGANAIY